MRKMKLGKAEITPQGPFEAGSYATLTFTFTVEHPIDDTGYIKICLRHAGDSGEPQFSDPGAPNYTSVKTTGNCHIEPRWDNKGHTRPWDRALFLKIGRGYLDTGDKVTVVFGDRSSGAAGWQLQTFVEDTFEFKTFVDPIATYEFKELPRSPVIRIVPARAVRAVCIAPSEVRVHKPFTYYLKLEDKWGNPTGKTVKMRHPGFGETGFKSFVARDKATKIMAESNPVKVVSQNPALHPYWADFHGQSEETIGSGSIQDYFRFARDYGLLDMTGHQGNDFQITDEFWGTINKTGREYYEPDRFVTFPGYEWSGNTPLGGDRNVYFVTEGGIISHSSTDLLPEKTTAFLVSPTARDLFRDLKKQPIKSFVFAHVGGRYADFKMHDPAVEIAAEIHSSWGTFEWLVEDALKRGHRIGIVANSDDHKCRPGASYPGSGQFGSLGGLTCVLARSLTREDIYSALRARHFYATTGNRPLMDVRLRIPGGKQAIMGDVVHSASGIVELSVSVVGSAPIESVEIRNGLKTIQTFRPYKAGDLGNRLKLVWSGAEVPGRARVTRWDGNLTLRGNAILKAIPINFWNANKPLRQSGQTLSWQASTTGGLSGIIIELEKSDSGSLDVTTTQGQFSADIKTIRVEPRVWEYGGLKKRIELYRLPAKPQSGEFSFQVTLAELKSGDNPLFVKMVQEDGHMAWSSPIYVVS